MGRKLLALTTTAAVLMGTLWFLQSPESGSSGSRGGQLFAQKKQANDQAAPLAVPKNRRVSGRNPTVTDFLDDLQQRAEAGGATILSHGDSYDDFTSIARTGDGTLYAAYAAYYDGHDQVRLHKRLPNGDWSTRTYVPLVENRPDIWMPQLAVDARDRLWLVWCEQTEWGDGSSGNWDLYARPFDGEKWGDIARLTDDPKPDINPHVTTDAEGNIHVVWQAHPGNNGDIRYCKYDGESWSDPLAVTADAESDWYPHAAVDRQGTVWIAFDSYRGGDYDVFLTSVRKNDEIGFVIPVAESDYYEAHASVACTPDGRVWVAWEQGGYNWGKDQGYWLARQNREQGTDLGGTRTAKVACWHQEEVQAVPPVAGSLPQGNRNDDTALPELAVGEDGRLWLRYRHKVRRGRRKKAWTETITTLTANGWTPAKELGASAGRISVFSRLLPADGSLWVAYSGDARNLPNLHRPIHDTAMVSRVPAPDRQPGVPELAAYQPPEPPQGKQPWNTEKEEDRVDAIRDHRVEIDGKSHRIVRGDLHRHTELSWDVGPGNDGSYLDFYRYMIDVAAMDFGGLTDHQGGGHYAYWWWLTEKSADMYYLPPRFVPLYGYERSVKFPNGHRNIFHAERGVPVFAFRLKTNQRRNFPGVGTGNVLENDTKLLYEFLHKSDGIAISHTSGSDRMGTDWRDNDPEVEPVVEIYQGARNSYEALGAPRVHPQDEPPQRAPGGFQKAGLLWNAWKKGYRLGTISSSDHNSTHISYALVYTPENDREAILDSIRRRHTYGATDNLIVDVHANGRFMGEELTTDDTPKLTLRATGTGKIAEIRLVRNNEYVYTAKPNKRNVEVEYRDMQPAEGTNYYYFRILQEDGEVAWASPVWINYRGG